MLFRSRAWYIWGIFSVLLVIMLAVGCTFSSVDGDPTPEPPSSLTIVDNDGDDQDSAEAQQEPLLQVEISKKDRAGPIHRFVDRIQDGYGHFSHLTFSFPGLPSAVYSGSNLYVYYEPIEPRIQWNGV